MGVNCEAKWPLLLNLDKLVGIRESERKGSRPGQREKGRHEAGAHMVL